MRYVNFTAFTTPARCVTVALIVSGSCSASWGGVSVTFVTAGAIYIKAGPLAAPGVGLRKAGALLPDGIP